jgi:hypothetical protein
MFYSMAFSSKMKTLIIIESNIIEFKDKLTMYWSYVVE